MTHTDEDYIEPSDEPTVIDDLKMLAADCRAKDTTIAALRAEIADKDKTIERLKAQIGRGNVPN